MFNRLKRFFDTTPLKGYAFEIDQDFLDANDKDPIQGKWLSKTTRSPKIGDFMFIATNQQMMTIIPSSDFFDNFDIDPNPDKVEYAEELKKAGYQPVHQIKDL